jgi:RHS repeat-associated protein
VTQGGLTKESYSYDAAGNRTASLGVSSYTTNSSNEMTANSNASYTYDYIGNTTSKTDSSGTTDYSWDYENRLTSVTLPGSAGTVTFKYDPFGRRIEKISPTTTSIFAYDGDNLIETTNGSASEVASYTQTQNIDEPLAILSGTTKSFYEADGLGSITSLTAADGSLAQSYAYDSFGNETAGSGSLTNLFRYTGRELDTETGLYFYRERYYDEMSGRFITEDPIRFFGGENFYRYVSNSAIGFRDSFGLSPSSSDSCNKCKNSPMNPASAPQTGGLSIGGTAEAGLGRLGGTVATGSLGVANDGAGSTAGTATGGVGTSAGNYTNGVPHQTPGETATYGIYVGAGVVFSASNGSVCQLSGPFKVINVDIGLGPGLDIGGSIALGPNGVYEFNFVPPGTSAGIGMALSFFTTNTAVKPSGCSCQ